jgi:hypothetical protein
VIVRKAAAREGEKRRVVLNAWEDVTGKRGKACGIEIQFAWKRAPTSRI